MYEFAQQVLTEITLAVEADFVATLDATRLAPNVAMGHDVLCLLPPTVTPQVLLAEAVAYTCEWQLVIATGRNRKDLPRTWAALDSIGQMIAPHIRPTRWEYATWAANDRTGGETLNVLQLTFTTEH